MGMLEGRVAVVTGAGRGIGAGIAKLFASQGASVVVNDLGAAVDGSGADVGPAQQVVNEIEAAGGKAVANTGDVSDHAAAENIVRTAIDTFGKLDVLVNTAGILRDRMIFNISEQDWDAVVRVHLKGTFNTTRFASAYWRELRDESAHHRIINFTSGSGLGGAPGQPNYAAAKMGIVGLTYSCANALRRYGVTSNAISPTAATRMTETIPGRQELGTQGRPQSGERAPENVAPTVAYIASEASDWLNGQVLGAGGYQVSLYSRPQVIRQVVSTEPWDLEQLGRLMERSFRAAVAPQAMGRAAPGRRPAPAG